MVPETGPAWTQIIILTNPVELRSLALDFRGLRRVMRGPLWFRVIALSGFAAKRERAPKKCVALAALCKGPALCGDLALFYVMRERR